MGSQVEFAAVMVPANGQAWWWYYGITAEQRHATGTASDSEQRALGCRVGILIS